MAISADYPTPTMVNGFSCRNCSDVANAKRHIDPAHPSDGPFGVAAKHKEQAHEKIDGATDDRETAFRFGGSLAGFGLPTDDRARGARAPRHVVDVRV